MDVFWKRFGAHLGLPSSPPQKRFGSHVGHKSIKNAIGQLLKKHGAEIDAITLLSILNVLQVECANRKKVPKHSQKLC